ncbi:hypothetical protein CVT25_006816 [Psilocybe cyanescens]|uniref:Uncharacterized protein n=1 Tax=Psilocybe cyanescens TaxID=93625 RepID=A0A409X797_PSICY|nr:hypothetical protein CVT25_006816 [Psilocybe cyanescens]
MASSTTASQEELKANRVPLGWRDSCSACQYDEYVLDVLLNEPLLTFHLPPTSYMRRMKKLSKQKLAAAEEASN